jgi:hypothetical protein
MVRCTCKYNGCNNAEVASRTAREHDRQDKLTAKGEKYRVARPIQAAPAISSLTSFAAPTDLPRPLSPLDVDMAVMPEPPLATLEQLGQVHELQMAVLETFAEPASDSENEDELLNVEEEVTERDNNGEGPTPIVQIAPRTKAIEVDDLRLQDAPKYDPRYPNENSVDPFYVPVSARGRTRISLDVTPRPVFMIYLLVVWLHTQCKVAFKACNVVLIVILGILVSAGAVQHPNSGATYTTLTSVLNNMGVKPELSILAVCPSCQEPYPACRKGPFLCTRCYAPVFVEAAAQGGHRPNAPWVYKPILQCPHLSIESQLREILAVPGMISAMDHWRTLPRESGQYRDMFDGFVTQNVKGPDGAPFFRAPQPSEVKELRIGLVLGFDW